MIKKHINLVKLRKKSLNMQKIQKDFNLIMKLIG